MLQAIHEVRRYSMRLEVVQTLGSYQQGNSDVPIMAAEKAPHVDADLHSCSGRDHTVNVLEEKLHQSRA